MAHRRLLALSVIACAVAAGCADKPEPPGPPSPERVQRCLSEREDLHGVEAIKPGRSDLSSLLTAAQLRAFKPALEPSDAAIGARSGGPVETDEGIAERPVGASELHFFPSGAEATDAADAIEPVVGSPDDSVFNGARVLGPALVLHYSFGMGDNPGGVGIQEDIEPVEACMRDAGYL
jgi:hypothetical protein